MKVGKLVTMQDVIILPQTLCFNVQGKDISWVLRRKQKSCPYLDTTNIYIYMHTHINTKHNNAIQHKQCHATNQHNPVHGIQKRPPR